MAKKKAKEFKEVAPIKNSKYKLFSTSAKVDKIGSPLSEDVKMDLKIACQNKIKELEENYRLVWGPRFNYIDEEIIICQFIMRKIVRRKK